MSPQINELKLLLIDPGYSEFAWNQTLVPPLGLLYLSASLRSSTFCDTSNVTVKIISMQYFKSVGENIHFVSQLKGFVPDVVGISCLASNLHLCTEISQMIKISFPKSLVVFGGIHPTYAYSDILNAGIADVVVRFEGEETFSHLINAYSRHGVDGLHNVKGIAFRDNYRIYINKDREMISDLDILPFPDREEVPYQIYRDVNEYKANGIITSRGCPYTCRYCTSKLFWKSEYRRRTAANVYAEIKQLKSKYNIQCMTFEDDIFTCDREYIKELCEILIVAKNDISWYAKSRIDCIDDELLSLMSKAGMKRLLLGFESVNQESLNSNERNMFIDNYEAAIKMCHANKIEITATMILGLPTDTKQDMIDTIKFLEKRLKPNDRLIRCLYVPFQSLYSGEKDLSFKLHTSDFRYFTMDCPITSSGKYTLDELFEVKTVADASMIRRRVRPGVPPDYSNLCIELQTVL